MSLRRRSFHAFFFAPPLAVVFTLAVVHCGGGGGGAPAPADDSATDATSGDGDESSIDAVLDGDAIATETTPFDAPGDTAPKPVTCTKAPSFGTPLRLNHSPDALRNVANGSLAMLPDGRLMVVFLESLDGGARYALYARIVDPTVAGSADADASTSGIGPDVRLDVDADALGAGSAISLQRLSNGALALSFFPRGSDRRLRVYSHGKWSPEISATMPLTSDDALAFANGANGTVFVSRARGATPSATAVVYRPDEGGAFGSWSPVQTLDLDGGSGTPTINAFSLADGRYLVLVWHGSGGPSVRLRGASGAWTTPGVKAEIGAADTQPSVRLLDDGTLVLVALEGSGDVRRVVDSTWSETTGWSTARLLSKTIDANGVIPFIGRADPFLFPLDGNSVEFVAWVAGCTGPAKDCQFHPISRRFEAGAWKDPVDLSIGGVTTSADGLQVVALNHGAPLVARTSSDGSQIQLRARASDGNFGPLASILDGSPLFAGATRTTARFFGDSTQADLWTIAARTSAGDGGPTTTLPSALGKIDPAGSPSAAWGAVIDGTGAAMQGFSYFSAYADGAGGFTVAVDDASDGSPTRVPILSHSSPSGGALDVQRVVLSDESNASFFNAPRTNPRPGGADKSAIFTVLATPSGGDAGGGKRLRAYAWNGVGGVTAWPLAMESRAPRPFGEGLLTYGCGGAVLYAVDPITDGSHALELVIVE